MHHFEIISLEINLTRDNHYEVRVEFGSYTLVLDKGTCHGKVRDKSSIPYVHAIAAIQLELGKLENYVHG